MPKPRLRTLFVGLLAALSSCSGVAIPYQDRDQSDTDPWIELQKSFEPEEAPAEIKPTKPTRWKRNRNLDHAMEIQVGGAVFANFDTALRFDSAVLGKGTTIDFENDLGFDDGATVFRWDLRYRLGMRHRLEFSNFSITRRTNWKLDKEITIGDKVYPINIDVSAALSTSIYKAAYRYLFAIGESWDLSASFGFHTMGLGFSISEDATLGQASSEYFTIPLPVIGLGGNLALSDDLRLSAVAELFGVEIKGFTGYLIDARLSLDWDIWEQVGAGVGWNGFVMDVEIRDKYLGGDLLTGSLNYKYQGLLFYLRVYF